MGRDHPSIEDLTLFGVPFFIWLIPIALAGYFWFHRQINDTDEPDQWLGSGDDD